MCAERGGGHVPNAARGPRIIAASTAQEMTVAATAIKSVASKPEGTKSRQILLNARSEASRPMKPVTSAVSTEGQRILKESYTVEMASNDKVERRRRSRARRDEVDSASSASRQALYPRRAAPTAS